MPVIHLIEGPVGAGKSTLARRLGSEFDSVWLDLDEWMVTLFSPDRPAEGFLQWYTERKSRCLEQIWKVAQRLLAVDGSVILELGLVRSEDRAAFYERVENAGCELIVYILDVPREIRLERVRGRNAGTGGTFKMTVSDEIFEIADAAWEPPDEIECGERQIRLLRPEELEH